MPAVPDISVASESETWAALQYLIDQKADLNVIDIDFSTATWATFSVIFRGPKFDQSLTSESMKGLIDFQNAVYRSIAIIIHDNARITTLTDDERKRFELVFKITSGSVKAEAEGDKSLSDLLTEAMKKMNKGQVFILIILFMLGYYGKDIYLKHIDAGIDLAKIGAEQARDKDTADQNAKIIDLAKAVVDRDKARDVILQHAMQQSEKAAKIIDESRKSFQSIMRGATDANSLNLQGIELPSPIIEEYNRRSRRTANVVTLDGNFRILSVDAASQGSFRVVVRESDALTSFSAIIKDNLSTERYHRVLQKAEWGKTWVRLKIRARKLGEQHIDAEIIKASTPRKSRF